MRILGINNNINKRKQPSFKAKVTEFNPLAKKKLMKLDKKFQDVFDGTSKEIKEIKFENMPVNIRLWGFNGSDEIAIMARPTKESDFWGTSEFNTKTLFSSFESFVMAVKDATTDIGKRPLYISAQLDKAVNKVNKSPHPATTIDFASDLAKERIVELKKEFAYDFYQKAKEIQKINLNGSPLRLNISGGFPDSNELGILVTPKKDSKLYGHLWALSSFPLKKPNGKDNNINGLITSIKKAVKNLQNKQNRKIAKVQKAINS